MVDVQQLSSLSPDEGSAKLLTLLLTLCGLTSQKTHRGGLELGRSIHEEAHPCFPYLILFNHPLKALMLEASVTGLDYRRG